MNNRVRGRTPGFNLRKFEVLNNDGSVAREQLGLAGVTIGEVIRFTENGETTSWLVESLPEPDHQGVLGVTASKGIKA